MNPIEIIHQEEEDDEPIYETDDDEPIYETDDDEPIYETDDENPAERKEKHRIAVFHYFNSLEKFSEKTRLEKVIKK